MALGKDGERDVRVIFQNAECCEERDVEEAIGENEWPDCSGVAEYYGKWML